MDGDSLTRMGLTLGLLLGLPGLMLVLMRRFGVRLPGQPSAAARLAIVSRLAVDNKHSLVLIRRDSHEQLILIGPAGATLLAADAQRSAAEREEEERQQAEREEQVAASRAALKTVLQRIRMGSVSEPPPPVPQARPSFLSLVEGARPPALRRHLDRAA